MSDRTIQVPAILTGFSTKVDGGASVRFATNELSDQDVLQLKRHQGKFGYLLFRENEFTVADMPTADAEEGGRTPSKRLHSVLHVLWKQTNATGDFDTYYRAQMEKVIDYVKAKLDQ